MYIYVSGREAVGSPRQPWPPGLRTTARAERRLGAWQTQSQRRGSLSLAACILSRSPVPGTVPYEYPVATLLLRHSNGMTLKVSKMIFFLLHAHGHHVCFGSLAAVLAGLGDVLWWTWPNKRMGIDHTHVSSRREERPWGQRASRRECAQGSLFPQSAAVQKAAALCRRGALPRVTRSTRHAATGDKLYR